MPWRDILASLTTNPSAFFKATSKGRVEAGMGADLVVLDADPARDVKNFAKVAYTIKEGKSFTESEESGSPFPKMNHHGGNRDTA